MDRSRYAASVVLLGLGIGALVVMLGQPGAGRDPVDIVAAAITLALGIAVAVTRRALVPAAIWATFAAVAGALRLIPPYEPRIGDVTLYLGHGLIGGHWNATGGYALSALGYGAAALGMGWSMGRSVGAESPHAWSRLSRLAAALLALLAAGGLLGAIIVGTVVLELTIYYGAVEHWVVMWLGALITGGVAWWAWHGRHPEAVVGWAALMFATSTLRIVDALGTDALPFTALALALPSPVLLPIELVARFFPDILGLVAQWFVAIGWLSVVLLQIGDRIARRSGQLPARASRHPFEADGPTTG